MSLEILHCFDCNARLIKGKDRVIERKYGRATPVLVICENCYKMRNERELDAYGCAAI